MTNPADQHIADLIEELIDRASHFTCEPEDRQIYVNQIAQLRASMNPMVIYKYE